MKKVVSVLLIVAMVMALAACGKKESTGSSEVTQAPVTTKEATPEPTKEPTPEPTKEVTPEPTKEPTSEPTEAVTPEPTEAPVDDEDETSDYEDDEFYSAGHEYDGIWQSGDCILEISAEGAADIIYVFLQETDMNTYGSYQEYWTNFIPEKNWFENPDGKGSVFYFEDGEQKREDIEEGLYSVEVVGDNLRWANMIFERVSENPYIHFYDDDDWEYSGDAGDGYGATFTQEYPQLVDVVATTFYGVYCESWDYANESFYYPYDGDEMSPDTMDEFNAAFLVLDGEDGGQLCFLEKGINGDVEWSIEDGKITVNYLPRGEEYTGDFYWDNDAQRLFLRLRIGEWDVWMTSSTDVVPPASFDVFSEEAALEAVTTYCLETKSGLQEMVDSGEYNIWWMVESSTDDEVVILYRSYTGAHVRYYVDRYTGETYVTESSPMEPENATRTDETFNINDYWR